jgi:hypothetical protein
MPSEAEGLNRITQSLEHIWKAVAWLKLYQSAALLQNKFQGPFITYNVQQLYLNSHESVNIF